MAESASVCESILSGRILKIRDLNEVIGLLRKHDCSKASYYELGLCLLLHDNTLKSIEQEHRGKVDRCFIECLASWLRKTDDVQTPTIDTLITALRGIGENAVADGINRERQIHNLPKREILQDRPAAIPTLKVNEAAGTIVAEKAKGYYVTIKPMIWPPYKFRMLLIGETGSGKTSFLNLLCNSKLIEELGTHIDGAKLSQIQHYHDLQIENSSTHQMESKTSDAKHYKAEICKLKTMIIDTPGFGDSRGLKKDEENVQKIINALKKEDYINCVCLIVNGRQSRMSTSLKYVLSEISTILPKEVFDNIIVVFTNTADPLDCNFDLHELESLFDKKVDHHFYIENPYCRIEKAKQKATQLSNDQIAKSLEKSFSDTAASLHSIHDTIQDFKDVYTFHFIKLYEKKKEIEKSVIKILVSYNEQKFIEKQIKTQEEEVDAALRSESLYSDFKTIRKVKVHKVCETPDKSRNTLCGAPGCYSNCHTPCSCLAKSYDQEEFKSCVCMNGTETCQKCGHSYRSHYNNEIKFEKVTEEKEFIDETMKLKFIRATNMREMANVLRQGLQEKREDLLRIKNSLLQELSDKITEFQQLGISQQNYAKVLEKQYDVVKLQIESAIGNERAQLNAFKDELEKKLEVVITALKQQSLSD